MSSNHSIDYSMTFIKESSKDMNNKHAAKKLAKSLAKTIIFDERKLFKLNWSIITTIACITVTPTNIIGLTSEKIEHLNVNINLFKITLVEKFKKYSMKSRIEMK